MKIVLKVLVSFVVLVSSVAVGSLWWANGRAAELRARSIPVHETDFPIPFPLDSADSASMGLTAEQAASVALERAVERGRHLAESRFSCSVCHGQDFGGGVMVDAPILGRIFGPNLTSGRGGRTANYTPGDWGRIVRHGVRPDDTPASMPSEDFERMSDRELSDLVAYIRSLPPVDNEVPPVTLGPLGIVLIATGNLPMSADLIGDHLAGHPVEPPPAEVSVEFGRHMTGVCVGCHGADLSGGPIASGDPGWGPAANLTPHADGLGTWSYSDFERAMRDGLGVDGAPLAVPMSELLAFTQKMTDTELQAMWMYLRSVPAVAGGT